MTDRQSLVPDNLPQGERKRTVDFMRQADIPLSPTQGAPAGQPRRPTARSPVGGGAPAGPLGLLSETTPGDFPFLTDQAQTPDAQPAAEPDSPVQALAASSQSTFGVAVLSRLTQV